MVAITRNGDVFLGSAKVPPAELPGKVKDLLTGRLDKTVFVKCDSRARYEKVVDVVDNLRAAGVDNIGLLTDLDPKAKAHADAVAAAAVPGGESK
jgi:biopolymer transport protein ExbD/biopolymer transport protein TolR